MFSRIRFGCIVLITCAQAATYYVGPRQSGRATGVDRDNLRAFATAVALAQPGDVHLLQPGNYGSVTISDGYGTAGSHVVYRRDPATTADPRGADWFEDETAVTRPDTLNAGMYVVFRGIELSARASGNSAAGHYITLNGLSLIGGNISLEVYAAYVTVKHCCVFGKLFDDITHHTYPEMSQNGISMYHWEPANSEYHHILVDSCYFEYLRLGVSVNSRCGDEVVFSNSHFFWMQNGAFSMVNHDHPEADVRIEGCHMHDGFGISDGADRGDWTVTAAGDSAGMSFTYGPSDPSYYDYAGIRLSGLGGTMEIRRVASLDKADNSVIVTDPYSVDIAAGDEIEFYDGDHGSVIGMKGSNLTIRNNRMHNQGNTGMVYSYITGGHDWLIENNLLYDFDAALLDAATSAPSYGMLGTNIIIRNNTIIGRPFPGCPTATKPNAMWNYGKCLSLALAAGTDPSTVIVSNNILVGRNMIPEGIRARNNHLYFDSGQWFETDGEGINSGNVVYGGSQEPDWGPYTWEQGSLFEFSDGWFVGGGGFDAAFLPTEHGRNFNDAFLPAAGSKGIDAGSAEAGDYAETDAFGNPRIGVPDAGWVEYGYSGMPVFGIPLTRDGLVLPNPWIAEAGYAIRDLAGTPRTWTDIRNGVYLVRKNGSTAWQRVTVMK